MAEFLRMLYDACFLVVNSFYKFGSSLNKSFYDTFYEVSPDLARALRYVFDDLLTPSMLDRPPFNFWTELLGIDSFLDLTWLTFITSALGAVVIWKFITWVLNIVS